jgi:CheY-like chemotaxis protein
LRPGCGNCQEALNYIQKVGEFSDRRAFPFPDALILEADPRLGDGFKLLRWLQSNPACFIVPAIVFSDSTEPEQIKLAYQLGANTYFHKSPFLGQLKEHLRLIWKYWGAATRPPSPPGESCG